MNKKVCSFPILFALLALVIGTCAVVFPASAQAAPTSTGSITVSGTVARSYDAYQIFSANVVDGASDAKIATDLVWASGTARDAASGKVTKIALAGSNVLRFELSDGTHIVVRPSGTEPKIKVYVLTKGADAQERDANLEKYAVWVKTLA